MIIKGRTQDEILGGGGGGQRYAKWVKFRCYWGQFTD
jgi:hypothetical protein